MYNMFTVEQLQERLQLSMLDAIDGNSKITDDVIAISGMSSPKNRHIMNNIGSLEGANYLEIGCYRGSTAISTLFQNNLSNHTLVENWKLDYEGTVRQDLFKYFNDILGYEPNVIEEDCFSFNPLDKGIKDIDIYFYDGEHEFEDQYKALTHYYDSLSDNFILVVDDTNYPPVLQGTFKAIEDLNLKINFHRTMHATHNGDVFNFWNGLYIAVLSKNK